MLIRVDASVEWSRMSCVEARPKLRQCLAAGVAEYEIEVAESLRRKIRDVLAGGELR